MKSHSAKVLLSERPFQEAWSLGPSFARGRWPARWLRLTDPAPSVWGLRLRFAIGQPETVRIHVSADERYELFLDGERVGRGPERGSPQRWFYESYDLTLPAGEHTLMARVWALGKLAPLAQMSIAPGFLLAAEDPAWQRRIGTGEAPWEVTPLPNYRFTLDGVNLETPPEYWATGTRFDISAPLLDERGWDGAEWSWQPAAIGAVAVDGGIGRYFALSSDHPLYPAELPAMMEAAFSAGRVRHVSRVASRATSGLAFLEPDHLASEAAVWQGWIEGGAPVVLPPRTRRRVLIDCDNYVCAYPKLIVSGGREAYIRLHWTEALYRQARAPEKFHRDEILGGYFGHAHRELEGVGSIFRPDGGEKITFSPLWWECGRYLEIYVETADEPVTLEHFELIETRYPFRDEAMFQASDERMAAIIPMAVRAWQMCSHETYFDCPFYEQLMYAGDSRVTALLSYVLSPDGRLPRKAVRVFADSLMPPGLTQAKFPSTQKQIIPPFSLWWVGMLHDYTLWRGSVNELRTLLPTARLIVEKFTARRAPDGRVLAPAGWNFVDWVEGWNSGEPVLSDTTPSGVLNWQVVLAYRQLAELEDILDEHELAARARRRADELSAVLAERHWSEERGLFAEDEAYTQFSEHSQCLALLAGGVSPPRQARVLRGLQVGGSDILKTSIYFSHYLFEAFRILRAPAEIFARLPYWQAMVDQGFRTTFESENATTTRSDCHAWGAHPLFHYYASILGIRPAAVGFSRVRIEPQIAALEWVQGVVPHPLGWIEIEIRQSDKSARVEVVLPGDLTGVLRFGEIVLPLALGRQVFEIDRASLS